MSNEAVKLDGGKELRHLMEELPKRVRAKGLRAAMGAAATPMVKNLRTRTPTESGLLKKAETKKIKTYQGGDVVVAVIGANFGVQGTWKGKKRVPAHYFHLVNDGTVRMTGQHMLQDAYDARKEESAGIALDKLKDVLEAEAAKG